MSTTSVEPIAPPEVWPIDVLIDVSADLICLRDLEGRFIKVNQAWESVLGYKVEHLQGSFLLPLVHPDDVDRTQGQMHHVETDAQKPAQVFVNRYLHKDGHYLHLEWRARRIGDRIIGVARDITHRIESDLAKTKIADELSRERARLLAAQSVAKIGSWETDLHSLKVEWSSETHNIFETSPERFEPTHGEFLRLVHPADREKVNEAFFKSFESAEICSFTHRVQLGRGRIKHVEQRWRILAGEDGAPARALGTCQDITDRHLAEEVLAERGALLRIAGQTARIGGWALTWPDRRLTWSDEVFEIVEYPTRQEPALSDALKCYLPGSRERLEKALKRCAANGKPFDLELERSTPDGASMWVRVVGQPERVGGKIHRIQGALQDISTMKHVEAALIESGERFHLLSRASKAAIWDWDIESNVRWWSQGLLDMLGLAEQEVESAGDRWGRRIHPDDQERVVESLNMALTQADSWEESYRLQHSDGSYLDVVDRGYVVRSAAGGASRILGSVTDVTERLRLEEQLRHSQKLEAVGQLTGGIAHDFNNLLTVIIGATENLAETAPPGSEQQSIAELALTTAERGAELVRQLLSVARKQSLKPMVIDCQSLVASMAPLVRRTLGETIKIAIPRPPSGLCCMADRTLLETALLNLCINARDAMPDGGALTISVESRVVHDYTARSAGAAPGDYVCLAVADTGFGMSDETAKRALEPFFTTKDDGLGSGLGLSMVSGFVQQSRGFLDISSVQGHGTTVRLYLPATGAVESVPARVRAATPDPSSARILVVEDDDFVRRQVARQLAEMGHTVMVAEDGPSAILMLRSGEKPDLLFTDMVIPNGMNGRELADLSRELLPSLRVLFTSGYTEDPALKEARLVGAAHFLAKPYRRDELARAVAQAMATPKTV